MPYTGIVLMILAFHAAAFLILVGHWLVAAGLFPTATRAFATQYELRPIRATLLGIFTYGPLLLVLLNSAKIPNGPVRALVIGAAFGVLLIAFAGSAGLALRIGRNLCAESSAWSQGLRGGVMLALVFITPVLGWFFLLPIGLASGFGAFLLAKPWRAQPPALPVETPDLAAAPALS